VGDGNCLLGDKRSAGCNLLRRRRCVDTALVALALEAHGCLGAHARIARRRTVILELRRICDSGELLLDFDSFGLALD
jgi:hypothetical protein